MAMTLRQLLNASLGLCALALIGLMVTSAISPDDAWAQTPPSPPRARPATKTIAPISRDAPVFYQADRGEYDNNTGIATLSGHVEFWQADRVLIADRVIYDSRSDTAAASGHVVLMEPDGQAVFSDYAELSEGLKNGVLDGMQALLPEGGRLVANGARRTDGRISELSRVIYSACLLCADAPTKAPLWQIRATEAVQDLDNQRIEYRDAVVDFFGIPVAWFPYLTHPDPTSRRASGFLAPTMGYSRHLGGFFGLPYYWAIDPQSDLTIEPLMGTNNGPSLTFDYRRRFNSGLITIDTSIANDRSSVGGHVFAKGNFTIDETWRWGFDINRASSDNYLRDFKVHGWNEILTSSIYLEGFGQGSYARLDARAYQGLSTTISATALPLVLPRYAYSLTMPLVGVGGQLGVDFDAFNVLRAVGSNTQRVRASLNWDRPFIGAAGEVWKTTLHFDSAVYQSLQFNEQPNYGQFSRISAVQAMPTAAVELRWPLIRATGGGTQLLEPIAQVIVAPRATSYVRGITNIPNEDSLDLDFTDASLFALNRYPGVDRLEGGARANLGLHFAWNFPSGALIDAQIGQAYRLQRDPGFAIGSGLRDTASDYVGHVSITPNKYLDITTRERLDRRTGQVRYADVLTSVGSDLLRVTGGYIYTFNNPYFLYDGATPPAALTSPRNELTLGVSTRQEHWRYKASARQDVRTRQMVALGLGAAYEDECFIFDATMFRRYTSVNGDRGATTILFQVTLKTVGEFGFNAQ
jgi:LPS-assembly protein